MGFRCVSIFLFLCLQVSAVFSQNSDIDKVKQQRARIEQQLEESQKLLSTTDKSIKSELASLTVLSSRVKERQTLLDETKEKIQSLLVQSVELKKQLEKLEEEYINCSLHYCDACRFYQSQRVSFNPLLFLFSAENYTQMSRRFRYLREYSRSIKDLADDLTVKKEEIRLKKEQVDATMNECILLQQEQIKLENAARQDEKRQRALVAKLQSKRITLKKDIQRQQLEMDKLAKEIDRLVASAVKETRKAASESQKQSDEDIKLTGSFESNKGKLPMPITGTYLIISNYGMQNVAGMRDVKINNLGIDIQGQKGAKARVVFDGTVSAVFQQGKGMIGVLVRHGKYITAYCNLSQCDVQKGDNLKTGQTIGTVAAESSGRTVLHFQIHRETTKVNPSEWLKK